MKAAASALATLLAFLQCHGHSIWATADQDHERKLLLNQADAAKRVDDIVKAAMASADAGDVKGVALPLNYVKLSANEGSNQQLTMALRLPGVDREQHVMIDTGSSSLAFCDKSLIDEAAGITKTDYAQCNTYGSAVYCPNNPSAAVSKEFYIGQIFEGNVTAHDSNSGNAIASMNEVNFAFLSEVQLYICDSPLDGIIGVAYDALNSVLEIPSPEFDVLNLWNQSCESDDPYYKSWGTCNTANLTSVTLPSPLEQTLQKDTADGLISTGVFGLYCDYAATIGSKVDTIVPSLGIFFGGNIALNNTFYNRGTPQVASVPKCPNKMYWYLLKLNSIRIPGRNMTWSGFDQCKCDVYNKSLNGNCYTDSGTSWIGLPLPESQCDVLTNTFTNVLTEWGSLLLDIEGVNGTTVTLSLPLVWLAEQTTLGNVKCTGPGGNFILGFPIFQYYYLAYDMEYNTIAFVDLQLSDETKAFIYGPELGGVYPPSPPSPSAGYHNHVSTKSNFMAVMGVLLLALQCMF